MAYATWDASLETGDELVDAQHRELVEILNELHASISQKQDRELQDEILDRLMERVRQHFVDEEALMRSVYYPGLRDQKRLHKEFSAEVRRLSDQYRSGQNRLPITLAVYMHQWILTHVRTEDRKIGEFIRERSTAPE